MHVGRHYSIREILTWTRRETAVFVVLGALPPLLATFGLHAAVLPWSPIAVLGIAVAFVTGLKSNAAYSRLWEARQIWGAIVNASRTWGMMTRDFVEEDPGGGGHRRLVLRHVAWLTALRHQLREPRAWETQHFDYNVEYRSRTFRVPEHAEDPAQLLASLLTAEEAHAVLAKKNRALAILSLQSEDLRQIQFTGRVSEYRYLELARILALLLEQQGKCERIKNFPYPRQFATLNLFFVWSFIVLLPFGVASELSRVGPVWPWLTVPITTLVAWVFHTMDKIGDTSENPFEGGPNDVPISALSRAIEIDLRDLLQEPDLPRALEPTRNILM